MTNFDVRSFLTDLDKGGADALEAREIVVDRTGLPRQAGAESPEGEFIKQFRERAERSLYAFVVGVLGRGYLTKQLHLPLCDWLTKIPPRRKLGLLPREHGKTSVVAHALPPHMMIQSKATNIYYPNLDGCDMRIILAGETETRVKDATRVVESTFESNQIFRALWPHRCWAGNARQLSKKWNDTEMIIPRNEEFPDPTLRAVGVGGAITGAHPTTLIKDDLVTLEAANSPLVMYAAIEWHRASRALINDDNATEFIIGTRWAVGDLYDEIIKKDPTVDVMVRAVVENGLPIYPREDLPDEYKSKGFDAAKIAQKQKEFGVLFPLLFMNSAEDPELTDFDMSMIRVYTVDGDMLVYKEDDRDVVLAEQVSRPGTVTVTDSPLRGVPLTPDLHDAVFARGEYLRARAT